MDDKTLQALTALANKMGTTAEYLWGVLLLQAPITGVIDLALMATLVALSVMWCRFVMRKTTTPNPSDECRYPEAEWQDEAATVSWLSVAALVCVTALSVTTSLAPTAAALLNPEYWALMQILQR